MVLGRITLIQLGGGGREKNPTLMLI